MTVVHVGVTLDCVDLELMIRFWNQALHMEAIGREGEYALLRTSEDRTGVIGLTLQRVPETKSVKNRMHFDIVVDDVAAEVTRLERLGATVLSREVEPTPYQTTVMADPEGHEFCVVLAHAEQ